MKMTEEVLYGIDWTVLERKLSETLGVGIRLFVDLDGRGSPSVISQDIVEHAGVMRANFASLHVANFGMVYDGKKLWFPVNFQYTHKGGGSNGCDILQATYHLKSRRWEFK